MPEAPSVLVVGLGNELRGDDGAGVAVARALRELGVPPGVAVREEQGETVALLAAWEGCDAVILVDAMRSGAAPGTVQRLDASETPLPQRLRGSTSSHAVSVGESVELARALDRLPARVLVQLIEGERFLAGDGLSDAVAAAVPAVARVVLDEAAVLSGHRIG